jgi:hypothetical protein
MPHDTEGKETPLQIAARLRNGTRRHKLPQGECAYCDRERAANVEFHPYHDASDRCQSGKHAHCTCDTCF